MDENFKQLCVWHGVTIEDGEEQDFVKYFEENFEVRVKFAEMTITNSSMERNEEGGRPDILFYIHDDDVLKFAEPRLEVGIRWWEDVVFYNDNAYLYSDDILEKYSVNWE